MPEYAEGQLSDDAEGQISTHAMRAMREEYRALSSTAQVGIGKAIDALRARPESREAGSVVVIRDLQLGLEKFQVVALNLEEETLTVAPSALERLRQGIEALQPLLGPERIWTTDVLGIGRQLARILGDAVGSCKYVCADNLHEFACGTQAPGPRCPDGHPYRRILR